MLFTGSLFDEVTKQLLKMDRDFFKVEKPISRTFETYNVGDSNLLVTFNMLGIAAEDIRLSVKNDKGYQILQIEAETKNEVIGETYSYRNQISIGSTRREVVKLQFESKDGILYVFLTYKEPDSVTNIISQEGGVLDLVKKYSNTNNDKKDIVDTDETGTKNKAKAKK